MICLLNLSKKFSHSRSNSTEILTNTNFKMSNYKSIALRGRSGSGKSTLLKIIAGLDLHYSGDYYYKNRLLSKNRSEMSRYRLKHIGIITQDYHLLTDRNIFDNIAFPLCCQNINNRDIRRRVLNVMDLLNISNYKKKYPYQLSGGQCQRAAIARAIVKKPDLILADEPTGALDETSEQEVLEALSLLINNGQSIIVATHSKKVSQYCEGEYSIKNKSLIQIR